MKMRTLSKSVFSLVILGTTLAPAPGADESYAADGRIRILPPTETSNPVAKLGALLAADSDKARAVKTAGFRCYPRSAPPVIRRIFDIGDGQFLVQVQLVHFKKRNVLSQRFVVVDAGGKVVSILTPVSGGS